MIRNSKTNEGLTEENFKVISSWSGLISYFTLVKHYLIFMVFVVSGDGISTAYNTAKPATTFYSLRIVCHSIDGEISPMSVTTINFMNERICPMHSFHTLGIS